MGALGSDASLVNLGVVTVEPLTGGSVLGEAGDPEMVLDLDGQRYKVEVALVRAPQGPARKFVLIGRRAS